MKCPVKLVLQTTALACMLIAHWVVAQPGSAPPDQPGNSASAPKIPNPPRGKEMRFRVVDEDSGHPIAGVNVRAWVRGNLVTDSNGACVFALPVPKAADGAGAVDFYYRINFAKDGYVPRFITWSRSQDDRLEDIPAEYTAKLEKSASIGGVVKNQAGEPIAGARVVFSGVNPAAPTERERTTVAPNYHVERTDENGRWHCNHVPNEFETMTFRVAHPDYLPTTFGVVGYQPDGSDIVALPRAEFRAGTAVLVLGHGIELSGLVTDSDGKPVSGASITRNREWRNAAALLETGADGRFKILNVRPGLMILTLQAQGLEPQTLLVTNLDSMPELKLVMKPGKILKGHIVDQSGQPIPNATVQMDRLNLQPLELDWSAVTDAQGRFLWDSAPAGPHPYFISASGFNPRSEPSLAADGADNTIVLRKSPDGKIFVDGKVVDSASKAPVEKFTLLTREFKQDGSDVRSERAVLATTGEYSATANQSSSAYQIEIRAEGYLPQVSDRISVGDGDRRIDFALQKGQLPAGAVESPDAKPASGPEAAIKTLGAGDAAPIFAVKTIEGRLLNLADFRGKYVLLDFWATWCGPCRGETPHLKATYDAYGKDPRFAMIGLSLDSAPAAPRDYARLNDIRWTQVFLDESSKTTVVNPYGVDAIPSIFLIDPEGKIAARDLRGDTIRQAVAKALGAN